MFSRNVPNSHPGRPMLLADAMNQLFSGAFTFPSALGVPSTLTADMNLYESDDRYILQAPLPGVEPGRLSITTRDNTVTIQGATEFPTPPGTRVLYAGTRGEPFHQVVQLPGDVDGQRVSAIYQNGVLNLILPKAASARDRTIQVSVGHDGQTDQTDQSQPRIQGNGQSESQGRQ